MFLKEWPPLEGMGDCLLNSLSRIFSLRKFLWKSVAVTSGTRWLSLCRNSLGGLWEAFLGPLSAVKKASMQWPFGVVESPGCLEPRASLVEMGREKQSYRSSGSTQPQQKEDSKPFPPGKDTVTNCVYFRWGNNIGFKNKPPSSACRIYKDLSKAARRTDLFTDPWASSTKMVEGL